MMANISCPLKKNARLVPNSLAIIEGNSHITYAQLDGLVDNCVDYLKRKGVKPSNRIGIVSANNLQYIVLLLAAWRIKAMACLLNTRLPKGALQKQIRNLSCRVIASPKGEAIFYQKIASSPFACLPAGRAPRNDTRVDLNQPATIMFTSGSTGEPKAALHSYGNHYYSALGSNEHIPLKSGDRWLLTLPLYHVGGLSIIFRTLLARATLVVANPKKTLQQNLTDYKITHCSCVTTQLYRLLQSKYRPAKNLKAMLIGGSAINDTLIHDAIKRKFPLYVSYGMTEMSSQIATSQKLTRVNPKPKVRVLRYRRLKISKESEILVKGKTLFQGYVDLVSTRIKRSNLDAQRHPERSEGSHTYVILRRFAPPWPATYNFTCQGRQDDFSRFPRNDIRHIDKHGWFYTKDRGNYSKVSGLQVLGRQDRMFISGGENIQPEEIERCLCQIKGITQAIVIGKPHREFGFRPVAFIQTSTDRLLTSKIRHYLAQRLPRFKIPDHFYKYR